MNETNTPLTDGDLDAVLLRADQAVHLALDQIVDAEKGLSQIRAQATQRAAAEEYPRREKSAGGLSDADWNRLVDLLRHGACTPFLGAGACGTSLPTGAQLSRH